jgi:Chromo (CHRromatin Organisation MOdifier) domain
MKIHPVFHVELLKLYITEGAVKPPPIPEILDDDNFFEVERVLQHREKRVGKRTVFDYLIEWSNYGPEHNSWEPAGNLPDGMIKEYWDSLEKRQSQRAKGSIALSH